MISGVASHCKPIKGRPCNFGGRGPSLRAMTIFFFSYVFHTAMKFIFWRSIIVLQIINATANYWIFPLRGLSVFAALHTGF